jgi:hypothetical protein
VFGGFLTNSTSFAMLVSGGGTITPLANQATFLGSFSTPGGTGRTGWVFPGAATAGLFAICNYYNQVLFTGFVQDTASQYTYTSATIRQANALVTNQISVLQASSERAAIFNYAFNDQTAPASGSTYNCGIGFNSLTSFAAIGEVSLVSTGGIVVRSIAHLGLSFTGYATISANEQGDGVNVNAFNLGSLNKLEFEAWL